MQLTISADNKKVARESVRLLVRPGVRIRVVVSTPANRNQTTVYQGTYSITIEGRRGR